jgi:hypothetical protein
LTERYYTGVGSRETPYEVQTVFKLVGEFLAKCGYVLRSGHAKAADQAFETGCDKVSGMRQNLLVLRTIGEIVEDEHAWNVIYNSLDAEYYRYIRKFFPDKVTCVQKFKIGVMDSNSEEIQTCYMCGASSKSARIERMYVIGRNKLYLCNICAECLKNTLTT